MADPQFIPFIPKCSNFKNIAGQQFGRLTALKPLRKVGSARGSYWRCRCDCGSVVVVEGGSLMSRNTLSCGCYQQDRARETQTTHRKCKTRAYKAWSHMIQRCDNPKNEHYAYYGGRGITYDPRWSVFGNFLSDMGETSDGMEIDRIDTDGNYCKRNCRWATRKENQNNKRSTLFVEHNGSRIPLTELADATRIPYACLYDRIRQRGWTVEQAINQPRFASRFKRVSR